MAQSKKETREQLERRIRNSIVLVPKDKNTRSVWFDDKGLRITITSDYLVVGTMFHQHVFDANTTSGVSRPYLYAQSFLDIVENNDCEVLDKKGNTTRSYTKLMKVLYEKEDKREHNIAWIFDKWLYNIFQPLYTIDETNASTFLVYESYIHNIARNSVILEEKTEDMTDIQFLEKVLKLEREYVGDLEPHVMFEKLTDEDIRASEAEALVETINEEIMSMGNNENENDDGK